MALSPEKNAWATNGPRVGHQRFYRFFGPPAIKHEFTGHQCQIPAFSATSGISARDRCVFITVVLTEKLTKSSPFMSVYGPSLPDSCLCLCQRHGPLLDWLC